MQLDFLSKLNYNAEEVEISIFKIFFNNYSIGIWKNDKYLRITNLQHDCCGYVNKRRLCKELVNET